MAWIFGKRLEACPAGSSLLRLRIHAAYAKGSPPRADARSSLMAAVGEGGQHRRSTVQESGVRQKIADVLGFHLPARSIAVSLTSSTRAASNSSANPIIPLPSISWRRLRRRNPVVRALHPAHTFERASPALYIFHSLCPSAAYAVAANIRAACQSHFLLSVSPAVNPLVDDILRSSSHAPPPYAVRRHLPLTSSPPVRGLRGASLPVRVPSARRLNQASSARRCLSSERI